MRNKVAKALRKKIYGDKDYRKRTYTDIVHSSYVWMDKEVKIVTTLSDKDRKWYQNAKKVHGMLKKVSKQKKEKKNESNIVKDN